ncbi:Aspartate--tRNA(Asp/Asn) ligase [uncultured archaeon]|nr:Aspartate--tRNA(Asp/Asn) ligase [uncultured archaeon]
MEADRIKKLEDLEAKGVDAYPYSYDYTAYSKDIIDNYAKFEGKVERIAGRIVQKRSFGKLGFCQVQDNKGKLQVMIRVDAVGEQMMSDFEKLDLGDIVGFEGKIGKTEKGEISLHLINFTILSKSLRTLPDKFKGLTDIESRYRKRYLDLISNPEVKNNFIMRTRIVDGIREFLNKRDYLEADTPILQKIYGGAAATPFVTKHHALEQDLYLRISNELYLKRLIIGGIDKVYEFSKDFRNEDIDSTHNPEFTQVEFYEAYKDYADYMKMTKQLFKSLFKKLGLNEQFEYQGKKIDFTKFEKVSLVKEIKNKSGIDVLKWKSEDQAFDQCMKVGVKPSKKTLAKCVDALFDHFVQPNLINPTFVIDFPYYMCPLTKKKRGNEKIAERFELFIAGFECGNCYSELTDPREQRRKLEEQANALKGGDEESNPLDEDFLEAMEYGMPPTAGMGLGIDRLAMILTNNVSIKEVILFPSVKENKT